MFTVHGRADHRDPAVAGGGHGDSVCVPPAPRQLGDLLQLEGQVWRAGGVRGEASDGAGGRERSSEADAGRGDARQHGAEGLFGKKVVTPATSHQAAAYLRSAHGMSERRAGRVIVCDRASIRYRVVSQPVV